MMSRLLRLFPAREPFFFAVAGLMGWTKSVVCTLFLMLFLGVFCGNLGRGVLSELGSHCKGNFAQTRHYHVAVPVLCRTHLTKMVMLDMSGYIPALRLKYLYG